MSSKEIITSIALGDENPRVGRLWCHIKGQRESASFEYDTEWRNHPERFGLEPALQLTEGVFHTPQGKCLFGAIGDSAPDRWGRILMRREESMQAQLNNRAPRTLFESDYLLGVNDAARQGALRFSLPSQEEVFLAPISQTSIPPLVELPQLLSATERFMQSNESLEDLRLLLAPGSSLGGARPKASILDKDGSLAIAKFPSKDDDFNVVVWEAVALTLAQKAGIRVPAHRLERTCEKPVLIVKRFDRSAHERIPFLSAMSMLGARDNESHSYLEIAYALAQHGACPDDDMRELWRRIVFTVMISNTDDHLRNHGFVYERKQGWRLSPVYDINPTPLDVAPHMLTTSIDFYTNAASLDTALGVAAEFRLSPVQAHAIIKEVARAVQQWRAVAAHFGLSKRECDRFASAFERAY